MTDTTPGTPLFRIQGLTKHYGNAVVVNTPQPELRELEAAQGGGC